LPQTKKDWVNLTQT
jgi:hypothetical protein